MWKRSQSYIQNFKLTFDSISESFEIIGCKIENVMEIKAYYVF